MIDNLARRYNTTPFKILNVGLLEYQINYAVAYLCVSEETNKQPEFGKKGCNVTICQSEDEYITESNKIKEKYGIKQITPKNKVKKHN